MTEFTVWAPEAARVRLRLPGVADHDMRPGPGGWWRVEVPGAGPGTDYAFVLDDDERARPDPRSAWQPQGGSGPSRLYDHAAYRWTDQGWAGRQLPGSILYELHVGAFTPEGTFDGVVGHLDHLVDLGVDLIELLPVNNPGADRGHEGRCWYAPDQAYGGPDGLKRLVDAGHAKGLGVLLDVAYHDVGPMLAPYLTGRRDHWGPTVDLAGPHAAGIRRYLIDGVLMWLRDYHVDGLRLAGGHALTGAPAASFLAELAAEVEALAARLGRPLSLIAESDTDEPKLITPRAAGGAARPMDRQRTLGHRFMAYLQNHDRIGDRAAGERIPATLSTGLQRVGATLLMTAPYTPMLVMGEEWAASMPWQFVTGRREPEPATAVAAGRRPEVAAHRPAAGEIPDRPDPQTFLRARLDWAELDKPEHRAMYDFYRRLIAVRKSRPDLSDPRSNRFAVRHGDQFLLMRRGGCLVVANLAGKPQRINLAGVVRRVLLATESGVTVMRDGIELPAESAAIVAL